VGLYEDGAVAIAVESPVLPPDMAAVGTPAS
jgi:hypothetical protein